MVVRMVTLVVWLLWSPLLMTHAFVTIVPSHQYGSRSFTMMHHHKSQLVYPSLWITTWQSNRVKALDDTSVSNYSRPRKYFMSLDENQEEKSTATTSSNSNNNNNNIQSLMDLSPTEYILATEQMDPTTRAVVDAARKKQQLLLSNNNDNDNNKYPIDLPSPVLLATSMILAIISTGTICVGMWLSSLCLCVCVCLCVPWLTLVPFFWYIHEWTGSLFQLFGITSNTPNDVASSSSLGWIPTALIVVIGAPSCIFLLYAAITKATAETEADDQAFLSGKWNRERDVRDVNVLATTATFFL